jgi:hypothetical protein
VLTFLVGNANDAARRAGSCVASLLALLVAALAEVVGAGVHDNGALGRVSCCFGSGCSVGSEVGVKTKEEGGRGNTYANNALTANQLDQLVVHAALGVALAVCLEVTQVTDVALIVGGGAVGLVLRVDYVYISIATSSSLHRSSKI